MNYHLKCPDLKKSNPLQQLTASENFFSCIFVFVLCRFCTSKQSFGYVLLDLARCVFVVVFVFLTDPKPKFGWRVFGGPRSPKTFEVLGDPKVIYENFAMLLGLSKLGNAAGVV